jgi:hypothetical protein
MSDEKKDIPEWVTKSKTIRGLIQELSSFEDQDQKVYISVDDGNTRKPISLVVRRDGACLLVYCG